MELLQAVLDLADRYGMFVVLAVLAVLNAGKILDALTVAIGKIYPAWRKERVEQIVWQRRQVNHAIDALKDLLEDARKEIQSARQERQSACQERRILQAHLLRHIAQYEQLAAGTVEAFRDVGDQIHQVYLRLCAMNGEQPREGERL